MRPGVRFTRNAEGVAYVDAAGDVDMYWGQGYVHARDRGLQMLLMRILGEGRVCEFLDAGDDSLRIDTFFRRMNWAGNAQDQVERLNAEHRQRLEAYCAGANARFRGRAPWELRLLGYRFTEWRPHDTVTLARMLGYLTLAQSQAEMERLCVELARADVDRDKLEELFPGLLGEIDVELLKQVTLPERLVPPEILWGSAAPRMMASNNWVVAGRKTVSGKPILANDPHLETNRLPNIWYEVVLRSGDRYMAGGSIPGLPGILSGRTPDVAWGVTYAFADAVDSWVEHCRAGHCYRTDPIRWVEPRRRVEVIRRKKKDPVEVVFYENEHGVIDGDPRVEGHYLATRWAAAEAGADGIAAVLDMWSADSVEAAMSTLGKVETAWNFVFADTGGHIGYQMSGRVPRRRRGVSGFVPLPGWKAENDWQGFLDIGELPRLIDPSCGFIATANNDLNHHGTASPINMPMGNYRARRIRCLLDGVGVLAVEDMFRMHFDVYSTQAERFMKILRPLLPNTPQGRTLAAWDLCYDADSCAAFLFECWYAELYREVFATGALGRDVVDYLWKETGSFVDFYANFDRVLLSPASPWFNGRQRDEIFRACAERALLVNPKKWGTTRRFMMKHILFGGRLPAFAGFDRGPITAIGNRATIHQGQIYRSDARETTFLPSYRVVTDLAENRLFSNLAGGPSDRRFSRWYCSDLNNWRSGRYKTIDPVG